MEKPADNDHPIHELLVRRWSPRAFADRRVEPALLRSLFEAARWAASSYNEQPWRFLLATRDQPAEYERALGCLVEANQAWARTAPVLVLTAISQRFARNQKPNRVALHDLGLAVSQLVVQATAHGLFVHQMAGVDLDRVREEFGVPEGFEPATGIALGYPGDPEALPESLRASERAPRTRKPLGEIVFAGGWERPSPIVRES